MTIFDGNRRREQRNARIEIDNARLRTEQLELSLEADFSNFWQAYRNNVELLKLEEENLVAANENYEIAMERYLLGDLSGIEMREAQKSLLDARGADSLGPVQYEALRDFAAPDQRRHTALPRLILFRRY